VRLREASPDTPSEMVRGRRLPDVLASSQRRNTANCSPPLFPVKLIKKVSNRGRRRRRRRGFVIKHASVCKLFVSIFDVVLYLLKRCIY
jgi:hypothetical protein